ncbi:3-(3-hydroxy-phenyl)propionate hydroxylase [Lentzea albidocapillata subsp. violacea]|uniref:3-(3-hydroxy-phenyl)propionate hydroxylase n=1 Tax=Lentzea albidocapillata subsp. violacea TaxID=128104 RepID=A0A1G9LRN7_9PSEU|nr:FAD-dependent oxidoreductase [Lentzea albidocapillata]SDL64434.1 3-(3-hydroxy-phenyl)propionate hydroxylase [Lentzea albidocapillata subsp. violacea]
MTRYHHDHEVVVVGGGPVGMLLSAELRLAGVDVVLVERLAERSPHSKAFGLHARSLEVLDRRGLVGRFREGARSWANGHFAGLPEWVDFSVLDSSHPYALLVQQTRTEELLEAHALESGVRILRGHEVTSIEQDDGGVTVTGTSAGGDFVARARYVVGCDGGSSPVRKASGIGFPGTGGRVTARLGDVVLTAENPPMGMERTERGLLFCVPLEDGYHRIATFDFAATKDQGEELTLDELTASMRDIWGTDLGAHDPRWLSWFTDSARLADTYRDGRLLIAGDAAHVHFPVGGQGLNLGLQDAFNLGWKLAAEVHGWAPDDLLDTYSAERRVPAARVLANTRAQIALMNPDSDVTALRDLFTALMRLDQVNLHIAEMLTGVDVTYDLGPAEHPLTGRFAHDLDLVGDGAPKRLSELLHGGTGVLLDLSGGNAVTAAYEKWAAGVTDASRLVRVSATCPGEPELAALLVRPDGYVAWAGNRDAELEAGPHAAAVRWFGTV